MNNLYPLKDKPERSFNTWLEYSRIVRILKKLIGKVSISLKVTKKIFSFKRLLKRRYYAAVLWKIVYGCCPWILFIIVLILCQLWGCHSNFKNQKVGIYIFRLVIENFNIRNIRTSNGQPDDLFIKLSLIYRHVDKYAKVLQEIERNTPVFDYFN